MQAFVGITIGNSQARAAIYEDGEVKLVPLEEGETSMPSAVLLHRLREVGKYAYLYSGTDPNLLVMNINRLLGRKYSEIQTELPNIAFKVENHNNRIRISDWLGMTYSPIEIYAMILRKLHQATERYLKRPVTNAVIAVQGSFDDFQRRSIRKAAESVFNQVKLINEPTAALLAMGNTHQIHRDQQVMTIDLGAGKCEIAIVSNLNNKLRIKAITGDTHLGSNDINYLILNYLARGFETQYQQSLTSDSAMARHEVLMAIEQAKKELEYSDNAEINVPFVNFDRFGNPLHLQATITRQLVKELSTSLLTRIKNLINSCLLEANRPYLNQVFLLGGGTKLPLIVELVGNTLKQHPVRAKNRDELAVIGAALYGAHIFRLAQIIDIEDVTVHSLGITTYTGTMGFVLKRQAIIPALNTKRFLTVQNNQSAVHIEVREGEEREASSNKLIGQFDLPLTANLPRNSPIDVTIGKDDDGIILVRAQDCVSGRAREITINYDL
ncbi:MAG: Hsp70 family protein [Acidobacteria bacterium]|nr:Hsp70 family protein [Acidobacteriota bacterium]